MSQRQFTIAQRRHKLVVRIEIVDDGPGVPEHLLNSLFYPMVTGRSDGTGLGLSIAQSLIYQHGGLVEYARDGGLTKFCYSAALGRQVMNAPTEVWVVDDDQSIRWVLETGAHAGRHRRGYVRDRGRCCGPPAATGPDAIITDIRMPGLDGLSLLERIADRHPTLPVIVMTGFSDLDSAVSAYRGGAFEYLPKPFDVDEAVELARRAIGQRDGETSQARVSPVEAEEIIGSAPAMQEVFRAIGRLSRSNITVLITGASGTGKELVARALHRHSTRARMPFIAINTAAIPRELLGVGAIWPRAGRVYRCADARRGRFEQANGGTLFLDEIGDMPAELQTRLLRVLADGEFYRVGGHVPLKVDVRIIAATHQDLEARVRAGSFREDLFHRLNVIRVHVPTLRERKTDIPILAQHFLEQAARDLESRQNACVPRSRPT